MAGLEIKTAAELSTLLGDLHTRLDAVEKKPAAPDTTPILEQMKVDQKAFIEKLGHLEVAVKAKGSWKEQETPVAYGKSVV